MVYVSYSLIFLIGINLCTGILPKLVDVIYQLVKTTWFNYQLGKYKCKPKRTRQVKEKLVAATKREISEINEKV